MSSKRTLPKANLPDHASTPSKRRLHISPRMTAIACILLGILGIFGIGYAIGRSRGRQARPVTEVSLPTPNPSQNALADILILGTVKNIDSSTITLQETDGTTVAVKLDASTRFSRKGKTLQASDVQLGSRVSIFRSNSEATAKQVVLP